MIPAFSQHHLSVPAVAVIGLDRQSTRSKTPHQDCHSRCRFLPLVGLLVSALFSVSRVFKCQRVKLTFRHIFETTIEYLNVTRDLLTISYLSGFLKDPLGNKFVTTSRSSILRLLPPSHRRYVYYSLQMLTTSKTMKWKLPTILEGFLDVIRPDRLAILALILSFASSIDLVVRCFQVRPLVAWMSASSSFMSS